MGVMSNLATVQGIYEAFGRGDVAAILDVMADDVAWERWEDNRAQHAGVPALLARTGKDGVAEFFGVVGTMTITDFEVLNLMEGGDQVAATFVIEAEVPGGGQYRDEEIHLWTFDADGKVCALRHYCDTAKHIDAWKV
jgi:ketosteroid isomerase-like protein